MVYCFVDGCPRVFVSQQDLDEHLQQGHNLQLFLPRCQYHRRNTSLRTAAITFESRERLEESHHLPEAPLAPVPGSSSFVLSVPLSQSSHLDPLSRASQTLPHSNPVEAQNRCTVLETQNQYVEMAMGGQCAAGGGSNFGHSDTINTARATDVAEPEGMPARPNQFGTIAPQAHSLSQAEGTAYPQRHIQSGQYLGNGYKEIVADHQLDDASHLLPSAPALPTSVQMQVWPNDPSAMLHDQAQTQKTAEAEPIDGRGTHRRHADLGHVQGEGAFADVVNIVHATDSTDVAEPEGMSTRLNQFDAMAPQTDSQSQVESTACPQYRIQPGQYLGNRHSETLAGYPSNAVRDPYEETGHRTTQSYPQLSPAVHSSNSWLDQVLAGFYPLICDGQQYRGWDNQLDMDVPDSTPAVAQSNPGRSLWH
ncbi:hypothetical protein NM688_g9393 [Phlebia brevispora]|uniref:Uncharacterized protein n=1 Tax=Phlebia brevispora TaxID=194682 RepID=A0ACC1RGA1_9APHY|nr:hypothetical protein NM688_g9393 [Phlebia brevispora]